MTGTTPASTAAPAEGPAGPDRQALSHEIMERCWRRKDLNAIHEMTAPECTWNVPGRPQLGNREFHSLAGDIWRAKPDLKIELLDMIGEGEWVAARALFTGTQTAELLGIPPTGRAISIEELVLLHWNEQGLLTSFHQEADYMGMLGQLGVVPPRGTGPLGQIAHTFSAAARFTWLKRKARRAGGS